MHREFAFPHATAQYAQDRTVDIEHLHLAVDVDFTKRMIRGVATLTFSAIAQPVVEVILDAVELDIAAVVCDGKNLEFRADGKKLTVRLAKKLAAGKSTTIAIRYATSPRRGLYFIAPDAAYPSKPTQLWSQGQDVDSRYWFPCIDAPHEKATTEIVATVPASMYAISNGELLSDKVKGKSRTVHWKLSVPHSCYLVTLVVGEFAVDESTWSGIPVTTYVEASKKALAKRTCARTTQMLDFFSQRFGVRYPYPKYSQVFVADFIFGGMENTSATTLTDTVLIDEKASLDYDIDSLIAHELAHQWFGDLVTCRDWSEGWLNEGFATYSEYLWHEHLEGRDAADLELDDWGQMYFGEDAGRYRRTIATRMFQEPIDIFDHHLYEKGGRVLHMLRNHLGDELFFAGIAHYLKVHQYKSVESRDLARAFEAATGQVLDWFFDQWVIKGAGHPELTVNMRWDAGSRALVVEVAQGQTVDAVTPLFRLGIELEIGGSDKDRTSGYKLHQLTISQAKQTFAIPLAAEPSYVVFNRGGVVLAQTRCTKPVSWWQQECEHASLAIDRIEAARSLARSFDAGSTKALLRSVSNDKFWAVREASALGLAARRNEAARDALLAALAKERNLRAKRGIVKALALFVGDELVGKALGQIIERGDKSYFVEAEACLSLGKLRLPSGEDVLRKATKRDSFTDVVRQHAYRGLAEGRYDAAIPLLLEATARGHFSQGRRAAASALASLVSGRRDAQASEVREQLESLLRDSDFRVQAAALESLRVVGDARSIAAIEAMMAVELDGRLRRRGTEVVRDLAESNPLASEVRRLRDEVESLRSTVHELRDQLTVLSARKRG